MVRGGALAAGAAVVTGAAFVTGASIPPKPPPGPPDPVRTTVVGQRTGYFNMALVMRDYKRAKAGVEGLNAQRARLNADLVGLRGMYADLVALSQKACSREVKEAVDRDMLTVGRLIEDTDRKITRTLNERATAIISGLYDELHATAAEMAREHGLTALLAYPDAGPGEADNPAIKELKLKPPAAHPFYLDPAADYTAELARRVNAKYAPDAAAD